MRRAIFPGSFDPLTLGHYDIIQRGITLFDELVIAIGINAEKKYMFSIDERMDFIKESFKDEPKIKVLIYEGLTVDFCKKVDANFILRGLRNPADFEFEESHCPYQPQTYRDRDRFSTYLIGQIIYKFFNC